MKTLELVKSSDKYNIYKKRSGRYGVQDLKRKWINGDDKTKILSEAGLITAPKAKAPEPEPEVEAAADETPAEATDDVAKDEAPADEKASDDKSTKDAK